MIRQTTLFALLVAAGLSLVLFSVKYQVQQLEAELTGIERGIVSEERAIHVLRAEWAHLNDPGRLRQLAEKQPGHGADLGPPDEQFRRLGRTPAGGDARRPAGCGASRRRRP